MIQLRFLASGDNWVNELCHEYSAYIKVLGVKLAGDHREVAHFVDVTAEVENTAELKKHLRTSAGVVDFDLTEISPNHIMGVVTSKDCSVCNILIETDTACFISSAATEKDCTMGYKLFLGRNGVPRLLKKLSQNGVGYRVDEISPVSFDHGLTARQLKVLKSAMDLGFYDYPRRISNDELSKKLGVKASTLSEILRRAEKKIVGRYLSGT